MADQQRQSASYTTGQGGQYGGSQGDGMQEAKQTVSDATDQAKQSATDALGAAQVQAHQVVNQVTDQASQVMGQVQERAASFLNDYVGQFSSGATGLAQALRSTGQNLREQEGGGGQIATYADRVADQLETFSNNLNGGDLRQLVDQVEDLARREPALFVSGALAAGLLLARFLKSSTPQPSYDADTYSSQPYRYGRQGGSASSYGSGYSGSSLGSSSGSYGSDYSSGSSLSSSAGSYGSGYGDSGTSSTAGSYGSSYSGSSLESSFGSATGGEGYGSDVAGGSGLGSSSGSYGSSYSGSLSSASGDAAGDEGYGSSLGDTDAEGLTYAERARREYKAGGDDQ